MSLFQKKDTDIEKQLLIQDLDEQIEEKKQQLESLKSVYDLSKIGVMINELVKATKGAKYFDENLSKSLIESKPQPKEIDLSPLTSLISELIAQNKMIANYVKPKEEKEDKRIDLILQMLQAQKPVDFTEIIEALNKPREFPEITVIRDESGRTKRFKPIKNESQ